MFETIRYYKRKDLLFYITKACNHRCRHCLFHKKLYVDQKDESFESFAKIVHALPRFRFISITGGEPFLCDDLDDRLNLLTRHCDPEEIEINTNGSLYEKIGFVSDQYCATFPNKKLLLQLSLLGSPETHDFVTNHKNAFEAFNMTVECVSRLLAAHKNLDAIFCVPIMRSNHKDVAFLFSYARKNKIKIKFSPLKNVEHTVRVKKRELLDDQCVIPDTRELLSIDEYEEFLKQVVQENRKYPQWLWPKKDRIRNERYLSIARGEKYGNCQFKSNTITILPNGDYSICELFKPIGNLFVDKKISKNKVKNMRQKIDDCICTHGEYIFKTCHMSNRKAPT
jgi:sulfatase maturation enzyme AslB (radical SAM superfamily)